MHGHGIPLDSRDEGESDAGVARAGLHDPVARLQVPPLLGVLDHVEGDAVPDAGTGAQEFQLAKDLGLQPFAIDSTAAPWLNGPSDNVAVWASGPSAKG
jgi:hypothetical protein